MLGISIGLYGSIDISIIYRRLAGLDEPGVLADVEENSMPGSGIHFRRVCHRRSM